MTVSPTDGRAEPSCPSCGGPTSLFTSKEGFGDRWHINRCRACGHGFVTNRPTMARLAEIYATEGDAHQPIGDTTFADSKDMNRCPTPLKRLTRQARSRGRSLDVGSGNGFASYWLGRLGFQPTLIDLDSRAEKAARLIPNSRFYLSSLAKLSDRGPFDAVIMSQVLEHELSPGEALGHVHDLLTPGGAAWIGLPNFAGVYRLLGTRDPFLIPPVHLNFFTRDSLCNMLHAADLIATRIWTASTVCTSNPVIRYSLRRKLAGHAWNLLSRPLNATRYGIMLHVIAKRPA